MRPRKFPTVEDDARVDYPTCHDDAVALESEVARREAERDDLRRDVEFDEQDGRR